MSTPDEIWIANRATYWPVAPIDLVVGAPLVVRALLGVTPLGRVVQGAVLGAYLANAVRDWHNRRGIRKIDFRREFGADLHHLVPMPREVREAEVRILAERLNDEFIPQRRPRRELAVEVDRHLTRYIASITGQRVRHERRGARLRPLEARVPVRARGLRRAVGRRRDLQGHRPPRAARRSRTSSATARATGRSCTRRCSPISRWSPPGSPSCGRPRGSSASIATCACWRASESGAFERLAATAALRPELGTVLGALRPPATAVGRTVEAGMRQVYDTRMRMTGQAGISDYDVGFTNFLYTFETSTTARQTPPAA